MKDRKLLNIELGRVSAEEYKKLPESGIVIVLDNIRSAHNVGSAFRTADSFKADRVILCGICAIPPSAEIHKSALGAEDSVNWEHYPETQDAIESLKARGYTVISVEQTVNSVKLNDFKPVPGNRYALVFGNEVDGVHYHYKTREEFERMIADGAVAARIRRTRATAAQARRTGNTAIALHGVAAAAKPKSRNFNLFMQQPP